MHACRIMAIIAFALLVTGAAWNTTGARDPSPFGLCYVLKDGIFAGGAVLTLVATALGLTSYVMLRGQLATTAAPKEGKQMPAGAAWTTTGQPQFPPQPPQGQALPAPPSYPQYSPSPQGQPGYGQAPNAQFPPAASVPYGQAPNPHYPPPAQGYGSNQQQQQFPPRKTKERRRIAGTPARNQGSVPLRSVLRLLMICQKVLTARDPRLLHHM